jgi:hypothetical protein
MRTLTWLALGVTLAATPAEAQMACGDREGVVAKLTEKYGETRRGSGLAGPGAIFEVFASEETGTWTILKVTVDGWACVMAVGEGWQDDEAQAQGDNA